MNKKLLLLPIALLLLCLAPMPYGYYVFVRFVMMIVFGGLAVYKYSQSKIVTAVMFGFLAILFQPIIKIPLGRDVWQIVDVVCAVLLFVEMFIKTDKNVE